MVLEGREQESVEHCLYRKLFLQIAAKQGCQLQMNVYKLPAALGTSAFQVPKESEVFPVPEDAKTPLSHDSTLDQTSEPDTDLEREIERTQVGSNVSSR